MMLEAFLQQAPRFLFFTGKGGVGKTSLACASAVALAERGRRVLLVSTDPASNLDEVLETPLGGQPTPVAAVGGLEALNIDPHEAARRYRERIVGPYRGVLPAAAVARIEEQLSGACTTEIASFNEFSRLLGDPAAIAGYDHVVLDTAPTGHTLRLLNLPAAWSDFIATNQSGSSCLGPLAGLQAQKATYDRALAALRDPAETVLVLVARAEASAIEEARRSGAELRSIGLGRQQLILNAVFRDGEASDPVARGLTEETARTLAALPPSLRTPEPLELPFRPAGSTGLRALRALLQPEEEALRGGTAARPGDPPPAPAGLDSFEALLAELEQAGHGVILTMGKGGVGKTTVAAEIALHLARGGRPVHLATTDPADHLSGLMAEAPANLNIAPIDPREATERHVREVLEAAEGTLDASARALLEEELRSPCIEEIAVFTAFARAVARGTEGFVVLDTAPTGHTLLLLDTTEAYHREVARNASTLSPEVRELLPRLRDPAHTRVLILTLPEATPVHEAAALQADLRRAGIEPYAWIINRCLHGLPLTDPRLREKRALEHAFLEEVSSRHARRAAHLPFRAAPAPFLKIS